jgi:hypothetical protein
MKRLLFLLIISTFAIQATAKESIYSVSKLVSREEGQKLIVQDDDYSRSLSKFDLELRVHNAPPTLENLNKFTQEQVLEWTDSEKSEMDSLLKVISETVEDEGYEFDLPDEIAFIKTTMNENKGAGGYTRLNYIVLSKSVLTAPKEQAKIIVAHELFHVISRYNPELRKSLYALIGFKTCSPIDINTGLKDYTIANPDAPNYDTYIELKDSSGNDIYCTMVLYSTKDYTQGTMLDYMQLGFLKLKKLGDGKMELFTENGKEKIYTIMEVRGFIEQIGLNTQYIIHPEEIIASNFELLFQNKPVVQSPELLEKIKETLKSD